MRYFVLDANKPPAGPYTLAELRQLHLSGFVASDTLITAEGGGPPVRFQELWAGSVPPNTSASGPAPAGESFTHQAGEDLRVLTPHLLVPLGELKAFRWLENRKLLTIAAVGLLPLFVIAFFGERDLRSAYWAMAFYFSGLWAVFFYHVFPAPGVTIAESASCFFGTGLISISVLSIAYRLPPFGNIVKLIGSADFLTRWFAFTVGVGLAEEVSKVLVLFFLVRKSRPLQPHTLMFYGLMAGLGFGIYEGVGYQTGFNLRFSAPEYYLYNLIRLTTLPFLHAIWTGIAAYFIGFAYLYPERKRGLFIVAIGVPALLHGCYNTFSNSVAGLAFALLSVLALNLYMAKSMDFERVLNERKTQI